MRAGLVPQTKDAFQPESEQNKSSWSSDIRGLFEPRMSLSKAEALWTLHRDGTLIPLSNTCLPEFTHEIPLKSLDSSFAVFL